MFADIRKAKNEKRNLDLVLRETWQQWSLALVHHLSAKLSLLQNNVIHCDAQLQVSGNNDKEAAVPKSSVKFKISSMAMFWWKNSWTLLSQICKRFYVPDYFFVLRQIKYWNQRVVEEVINNEQYMKSSTSLSSHYYKFYIYQLLTKCSPSSFTHLFPHSSPPSPKIHGYSAVPNQISPIRHVSRSPYLGLFCTPAVPQSKAVPQLAGVGMGRVSGPGCRPVSICPRFTLRHRAGHARPLTRVCYTTPFPVVTYYNG